MAELVARLRADLIKARKSQDKALTLLLGTVLADINNRAIELKRDQLTDDEVGDVLRKGLKQRRESLEIFTKAGRTELADKERNEIAALEQYLPAQLSDDEIRSVVREAINAGSTTIGAVMGRVAPQLRGKAEGARVNAIAREELAGRA
jgi:uncharacterized protein